MHQKNRIRFLARALFLLLAALLIFTLAACRRGSDLPLSPGLSMIEGVPVHDDNVAMRTDHFTVTPGMMAFFFYDYGGELMTVMEEYKPFDQSRSLHDQIYRDDLSWYDVMMNETLAKVSEMLIYCEAAMANGVELTSAQLTVIEEELSSIAMSAATYYGKTVDAYLQGLYGPLMSGDALREVLKLELLATTYSVTVNKQLEQGITERDINDYVAAEGLSDRTLSRNIAYIAVPYAGGKADDSKVGEVLTALQGAPESATFDRFSSSGAVGAEAHMTPDNTGVAEIKSWLFAAERQIGDYGRVEVGDYTYVLLYTGNGMNYAQVSARMSLYNIAFAKWRNGWVETLTFGYNYDVIDSYDIT
ncbi:MAG: hypothetical protein E7585_06945 [Ruminococcaceae bacterium]|nr:hypothetical protein [Oscillospiraceae bacterium]